MQAIQTKYLGPTNSKGSRIKVMAWAGSRTYPYPFKKNMGIDAHAYCAEQYAREKQWDGQWFAGGMPDESGYIFVNVRSNDATFTVESEE